MAGTVKDLSKSDIASRQARKAAPGGNLPHIEFEEFGGTVGWRLSSGNFCLFDRQRTNAPHLHKNAYEICLVLDGSGIYYHGEGEYHLGAGDLFLADPGIVHEITSHDTGDLHLIFFTVFLSPLPKDFTSELPGADSLRHAEDKLLCQFLQNHEILCRDCDDLLPFADLLSRSRSPEKNSRALVLLWRAFALECLERLTGSKSAEIGGSAYPPALSRAIAHIDNNAFRCISVSELAETACLSERQLRRLFRQHLDCGLSERIRDSKLTRTLHLLSMRFSVGEVARMSGLSSQAQFCRLFKRRFGFSPKEYQARYAPRPALAATRHTFD